VVQDAVALRARLKQRDAALAIRPEGAAARGRGGAGQWTASGAQLVLVGEVAPPVVDGHVVQASDIDFDTSFRIAAVAYGTAGPARAGALQVIDFSDAARPRLLSEVQFHGADVHAVVRVGSYYYVGVARDGEDAPAAVEELRTHSSGVFPTGLRRALPSYAVTDLAASGTDLIATCGDAGGAVVRLLRAGLSIAAVAPVDDARAVAFAAGGEVRAVNGGAGASILRYSLPDLGLMARVAADGFRMPESKGTIEVVGGWSFVGAGDGGFQVVDAGGQVQDRIDNPVAAEFAPELVVANAATARGNLAFVANGAFGVRVVDLGRWNPAAPPGTTAGLTVLGSIDFPDGISSNMVKARTNVLLVAAGTGGVKLVRILESPS
jgi:hypothetical protein